MITEPRGSGWRTMEHTDDADVNVNVDGGR